MASNYIKGFHWFSMASIELEMRIFKINCTLHRDDTSFLSNENDLCDNSTYEIAMEFYDDLECFVANQDDDHAKL